jgi:DNA helicase-2/ATP-dependent DNA helicase PcrA
MTTEAPSIKRGQLLDGLNPQQRAAAEHCSGPLLVIAGAGTGKTKTLAARVAALIQKGTDPARILLLTFTRRAAAEMLRRAGQVVGETVAVGVWGGTFHGVANRLLRVHGRQLGLSDRFVVIDQGDAQDLLHLIRTELELHRSHTRFPQKGTLLAIYSSCVNTGVPLEKALAERFPWCQDRHADIRRVFQEYTERKLQRNLVDYDDLLLYWQEALSVPGAGDAIADRFQHVLVDEYQDTNPLQSAILEKTWTLMTRPNPLTPIPSPPERRRGDDKQSPLPAPARGEAKVSGAHRSSPLPALAGREDRVRGTQPNVAPADINRSIMVVGDDAQSIYSFRGGTIENILRFPDQFAGTVTVTLEQNYRSVMPILEASNAVMRPAAQRFTKNLWSERAVGQKPLLITCTDEIAQSTLIADRILEFREEGTALMRQAVLFRAGHNSDALEVELGRRNIPFVKWGGLKFLEAAHVKDLLAFLRVLENPHDDLSWMRVLQMFDGIGPGRARQAIEHLNQSEDRLLALRTWPAPAAAREHVEQFARLLAELGNSARELPLPAQIYRVRRFYGPLLEDRYDNPEVRLRDLDQLELLAQRAGSRAQFLADLVLDPPTSTSDLAGPPHLDEEYVVLSTIHSAKGCEWDVVYVIHAADGIIPSDMSRTEAELEEERRLLYVAMTRARNRLVVTYPLRYYHRKHPFGDTHSYAQLSRFLPPEIFPLFERSGHNISAVDDLPALASKEVTDGVRSRVRRLWE